MDESQTNVLSTKIVQVAAQSLLIQLCDCLFYWTTTGTSTGSGSGGHGQQEDNTTLTEVYKFALQ